MLFRSYKDSQMKNLVGNIGVYGRIERLEPLGEAGDDCFTVEVYTAGGDELISTRTFVRTGEDAYEVQQ